MKRQRLRYHHQHQQHKEKCLFFKLTNLKNSIRWWLILVVLGLVVVVVVVAADTTSTTSSITTTNAISSHQIRRRKRRRHRSLLWINQRRFEEEMLLVGEDDILPLQDDDVEDNDEEQDYTIPRGNSAEDEISRSTWWEELSTPNPPPSRRLHSATVFQTTNKNNKREYMIISGGFTDEDRTSFPVYAFDMTAANNNSNNNSDTTTTLWYNLGSSSSNNNDDDNVTSWPTARVGHISAVSSTNDLYLFGGSTYYKGKFHMADQYLWKATLNPPFSSSSSSLQWQKLPLLNDNFPSRGETAGGIWKATPSDEYFIIYGGLSDTQQQQQTLGDVWAFHLTNHTLEQWFPRNNTNNEEENAYLLYPDSRTAHAVTISSNKLYVHGGMTLITLAEVTTTWAAQPQTLQQWEMLDDVWVFDLHTKSWSYRDLQPRIARSYHSIISKNETIVSCGGYRMEESIAGELLKFSFADVLVSFPNNPYWYQAVDPSSHNSDNSNNNINKDLPHRYQHSAAVDTYGSMYVWGGRFRAVSEIKPTVWRLDILDSMGNVAPAILMERASSMDAMDGYNAELETLHLMVAVLIVTSILFTTLFSSLRRSASDQEASMNVPSGVVVTSFGILHLGGDPTLSNSINRRGGVSQDILDALPVKTYCQGSSSTRTDLQQLSSSHTNTSSNDNSDGNHGADSNDELPCCLICLVDYENGDEVRTLPCSHDFHKDCVDSWLYNHSSCPACRSSIDRSILSSTPIEEGQQQRSIANDPTPWTLWASLARELFTNRIAPFRRIDEEEESSPTTTTSTDQNTSNDATMEDPEVHSLQLQIVDGTSINNSINENNLQGEGESSRTSSSNSIDWRSSSSRARRLLLSRHSRRGRHRRRALELVASYSTSSLIEEGDPSNVII